MQKGFMVINEFLHQTKFTEIYQWLKAAADQAKLGLDVYTNAELAVSVETARLTEESRKRLRTENYEFCLFWDKDILLARALEREGYRLFNSAKAIAICDDKAETFFRLAGETGIRMPKTIAAPMTYGNIGYTNHDFLKLLEEKLCYPMVIKENFGSFGAQVYLAEDREEAVAILRKTGGRPVIFQEFIKCSAGRDLRINMVGRQPVASMERYHESDFRANVSNGGKMKPYTPNEQQIKVAVSVCEKLGLDFGGVDLLFGEDDVPILCEVNSNAHFKNIYDCTGINVANAIMEYIKNCLEKQE